MINEELESKPARDYKRLVDEYLSKMDMGQEQTQMLVELFRKEGMPEKQIYNHLTGM